MSTGKERRLRLGDIIAKMDSGDTPPGPASGSDTSGSGAAVPPPAISSDLSTQPRYSMQPALPTRPESASTHAPQAPAASGKETVTPPTPPPELRQPLPPQGVAASVPLSPDNTNEEPEEFDIFKYIGIILRRKMIISVTTIVLTLISFFSYLTSEKHYTASARLIFRPNQASVLGQQMSWYSFEEHEKELNTHLELLRSSVVLDRVSENLSNRVSPTEISGGMTIKQGETDGEKNNIIELSYRHRDPDLSRDVVNEQCRTYIDYHREVSSQEDSRLILKLKTQIDKLQMSLDEKESALRRFKEHNEMVELTDEANIIVNKLSNIEVALQETQIQLLESKERMSTMRSQISQQEINIVQSMTYNNPFQQKITELELQLSTLAAEYSPDHFKVQTIKQQIEKLKQDMLVQIATEAATKTFIKNPIREGLLSTLINMTIEVSALETKRTAQEQVREQLNSQIRQLPQMEQEYAFLQREAESILYTLRMLKTKFEEVKIQRDSRESDLKIFELAKTPMVAFSTKKVSSIIIGLFVGIILGFAIAFLLDYLDQSIKEPGDVERFLELPLFGVVPLMDEKKIINEKGEKPSKNLIEPFRALRANLKHITQQNNMKVLMLCSAVKGEGKTTLAINLAISLAIDGKKVILVDGDLRRSQIHHYLSIPKENGFCDYLNETKALADIVKPTEHENLFVITSGDRPFNPAELLGTPRFEQMIGELRTMTDIVIFDSPAFLPVSDTMTMAPKMDAVILVVRSRWTPLKAAKQTKNQLKRIDSRIIGAIYNGVSQTHGYYPYYYGYYGYYAYRYAYTYEEEPRRRLSLREWGLKVESTIREHVRQSATTVPRLVAGASTFSRYLAGKGVFWILLILLVASIAIHISLRSSITANSAGVQLISRVSTPAPVKGNNSTAIENFTAPVVGALSRSSPGAMEIQEQLPSTTDTEALSSPRLEPAETSTFAYRESLSVWRSAWQHRQNQVLFLLYDSLRFQYPGGFLTDWISEIQEVWSTSAPCDTLAMDTVWVTPIREHFMQTHMIARCGTAPSREWIMIWHRGSAGWRIIREKEQGVQ
jgi:succinoglycan biosynthesis transport protein ExoP